MQIYHWSTKESTLGFPKVEFIDHTSKGFVCLHDETLSARKTNKDVSLEATLGKLCQTPCPITSSATENPRTLLL
jgi:hypothetical protein